MCVSQNTRGIDDGKDINPVFLGDIYDRITTNEIKMKDDPYRAAVRSDSDVSGQKRVHLFMKESQQMVKKTQDLIRSISVKGKDPGKERHALEDAQEDAAGDSGGRKGGKKDKDFYLAQDSDWQACGAMFEILWYPSLATFSVLLEENESESMIQLCLTGDHRVLTRCGWTSIQYVQKDDEVLSFNKATYALEWKPVLRVSSHPVDHANKQDDLFRMQGLGMDVIATRNHRMLLARIQSAVRAA